MEAKHLVIFLITTTCVSGATGDGSGDGSGSGLSDIECAGIDNACPLYFVCRDTTFSYECVCVEGYVEVDSICKLIDGYSAVNVSMVLEITEDAKRRRRHTTVVGDLVNADVDAFISEFFQGQTGSYFRNVVVLSFSSSIDNRTLNVEYTLIFSGTYHGISRTVSAFIALSKGEEGFTISGQNTLLALLEIQTYRVDLLHFDDDQACGIYEAIAGSCPAQKVCLVTNQIPYCVSSPTSTEDVPEHDDGMVLTLALALSLPFVIIIAITALYCYKKLKLRLWEKDNIYTSYSQEKYEKKSKREEAFRSPSAQFAFSPTHTPTFGIAMPEHIPISTPDYMLPKVTEFPPNDFSLEDYLKDLDRVPIKDRVRPLRVLKWEWGGRRKKVYPHTPLGYSYKIADETSNHSSVFPMFVTGHRLPPLPENRRCARDTVLKAEQAHKEKQSN